MGKFTLMNPSSINTFGSFAGMPRSMSLGIGYALALAERKLRDAYLASQPGTKEYAAANPIGARIEEGEVTMGPGKPWHNPKPAARGGGGGGGGSPGAPDAGGPTMQQPTPKSNLDIPVNQQKSQHPNIDPEAEMTGKSMQLGTGAELGMPHTEINYTTGTVTGPTGQVEQKNAVTGKLEPAGASGAKSIDKNLMTKVDQEKNDVIKTPSNFSQYGKAVGQGLQGVVEQTPEEEEVTEESLMNFFGNAATSALKVPFGGP